jgi:hypothetical protein
MATTSSIFLTTTDAGSVALWQTTAFQSVQDKKMAAGTMSCTSLHHDKGLEFTETTIAEQVRKRQITGLSAYSPNRHGIAAACALQIEMADTGNEAQTCVLLFRTMINKLADKNGLKEGAVYVTLQTRFSPSMKSRCNMAAYLSKALGTHGDACLEALGRGEHVHVAFIETLVEQIQLTMQGYTAPARRQAANVKVVSRAPSSTKFAKRQVVVHDGGEVAATLIRNALRNEATRYARVAAVRAEIKSHEFENEKTSIANNVAVLDFAKDMGVRLTLQVGVNCAVYGFFAFEKV